MENSTDNWTLYLPFGASVLWGGIEIVGVQEKSKFATADRWSTGKNIVI